MAVSEIDEAPPSPVFKQFVAFRDFHHWQRSILGRSSARSGTSGIWSFGVPDALSNPGWPAGLLEPAVVLWIRRRQRRQQTFVDIQVADDRSFSLSRYGVLVPLISWSREHTHRDIVSLKLNDTFATLLPSRCRCLDPCYSRSPLMLAASRGDFLSVPFSAFEQNSFSQRWLSIPQWEASCRYCLPVYNTRQRWRCNECNVRVHPKGDMLNSIQANPIHMWQLHGIWRSYTAVGIG